MTYNIALCLNDFIDRFYTRGRIIRLDKLFSVVRRSRRITEDNSSRRIMRLVPVFILETDNQTSNKYKFFQTDNASSTIKTAIHSSFLARHRKQALFQQFGFALRMSLNASSLAFFAKDYQPLLLPTGHVTFLPLNYFVLNASYNIRPV